jgi:hypothetical protein
VVADCGGGLRNTGSLPYFEAALNVTSPLPKTSITPGEAQSISLDEVCSRADAEVIRRDIHENIQRAVFKACGIRSPRPGQYEIDYLITPDLAASNRPAIRGAR